MLKFVNKIIVLFMVVSLPLIASELRWTRVDLNLSYADINSKCDNLSTVGKPIEDGGFYLALELKNGQIIRAQLNNFPNVWPYTLALYKKLPLTTSEIAKMTLLKDPKGKVWLKTWELNERLLRWIGSYSTDQAVLCEISRPLQSAEPASLVVEFETEGLSKGIEVSYSKWFSIASKSQDPRPYKMNLQLVQKTAKGMW